MKIVTIEKLRDALALEREAGARLASATLEFLDELIADHHRALKPDSLAKPHTALFPSPEPQTSSVVRQVMKELADDFHIDDVVRELQKHGKENSRPVRAIIRNEINKLKQSGDLIVVEIGRGCRSGTYRRKL